MWNLKRGVRGEKRQLNLVLVIIVSTESARAETDILFPARNDQLAEKLNELFPIFFYTFDTPALQATFWSWIEATTRLSCFQITTNYTIEGQEIETFPVSTKSTSTKINKRQANTIIWILQRLCYTKHFSLLDTPISWRIKRTTRFSRIQDPGVMVDFFLSGNDTSRV